jgi:predicted ester cyclase
MTDTVASTAANTAREAAAVVRRLYAAYNEHDVDAVLACWKPGGVEHLPLVGDMAAPDEVGRHLRGFFAAFPDARVEVDDLLTDLSGRAAARVRLSGTFTGARFDGLRANGRRWTARMAEFFVTEGGLITRMDAYMDNMDLARQLGVLPPQGGPMESFLRGIFNLKVTVRDRIATRH